MLKYSNLLVALIGIFCIFNYPEIQSIQAQVPAKAKLTYKEKFDRHTSFVDENCVRPQKRRFENLKYELCLMEDIHTRVSIEGPEGDNGPTAYFYGGKLFAFRDTGSGQAWMFENGKLIAEVEVGVIDPKYNRITTQFSAQQRKEYTDWAMKSTRNMLKVFGYNLNL
ncbi:hypothetical protein FACHB389_02290 [Nostoc calcicola FACHB-389]|nr:hypothetical protein [Nostoc calcicola FACHB-3891]MDZ8063744.1 hypothetical protein [Nostoc sp. EkiNYC01]OKH42230.1 hypothetical protein FACHB389_02290 [Nostoc calcicola FACHB-389]